MDLKAGLQKVQDPTLRFADISSMIMLRELKATMLSNFRCWSSIDQCAYTWSSVFAQSRQSSISTVFWSKSQMCTEERIGRSRSSDQLARFGAGCLDDSPIHCMLRESDEAEGKRYRDVKPRRSIARDSPCTLEQGVCGLTFLYLQYVNSNSTRSRT